MSEKQARTEISELHNETAIKEVQHLLKSGVLDMSPDLINKLRTKYSSDDTVVDAVMDYFTERREKITKVAEAFMAGFERHCVKRGINVGSMSLSKFIKRALKYKKRYELSDEEFDEIRRRFEAKLFNTIPLSGTNVVYPNTNLSRVLGYPVTESSDGIKPANSEDFAHLQDILKIAGVYKQLHSFIIIQTMLYTDMAEEAMNGRYKADKHDVNNYVHPVLAALFLPKIPLVEERMLYASIAGIMNTRYYKERIITKPDYDLFYAMIVDPSDTVCDVTSPMKDIKSRTEVQIQLWRNVYSLRNGNYYDPANIEFNAYIDKCRISSVDNPDMLYLSDEGVILRRLFAIFSYRPIIVSTQPVFGMVTSNPFNLPVNPQVITSIPYITYKLPQIKVDGQVYSLSDANNQIQFYMENGVFVPKATQIIDTRGPLVFYVPRRFAGLPIKVANPQLSPFGFTELSASARHYQQINGIDINYDNTMEIHAYIHKDTQNDTKTYYLRSAVALEKWQDNNIILGHMTYLFKYPRDTAQKIIANAPSVFVYIPRRANLVANNSYPIITDNQINTKATLSTCGTIFVYADN